jgi:DNA-binding NarL/FixJ family response regulator
MLEVAGAPLAANTLALDPDEKGATVLIIEDHALLAQSLAIALNAEGCLASVADLIDRATLLAQVSILRPSVVLLDLDLGVLGDGVELVLPLSEFGARVLVVSGTTDRVRLAETVERGAVGFLSKTVPFGLLLSTVLDVVAQRPVLSTAERYEMLAELRCARAARGKNLAPFRTLTPKEQKVLGALAQGQRVDAIAADAVVSKATVRTQIRCVLSKLGVNSQMEAVALAWTAGWFPTATTAISRPAESRCDLDGAPVHQLAQPSSST